ncbi:MAG: hypothetical protein AB7O92_21565 [Acidimicrobiia bacterium]
MRHIDTFYTAMSREEDLAPSTVKQLHNALFGSLDQAVKWGVAADAEGDSVGSWVGVIGPGGG